MLFAFICLALGGLLKGATGAGAPLVAVPALAMLVDVPFAVAVMVVPGILTNLGQAWVYRAHRLPWAFFATFTVAGSLGMLFGSYALASLDQDLLSLIMALAVFAYIGFRLLKPDWIVSYAAGLRLSLPLGMASGMLQGAAGMSAPTAVTFLNAMRLERPVFIATISSYFFVVTVVQLPTLGYLGIMTQDRFLASAAAIVPLLGFMPVGAWLARRFSRTFFDRFILALLAVVGTKLMVDSLL
ncbi:sulfite exporter TauE/SafE family protein [Faunimonas sp. B44]|uniref:sulfite exporter TauE/SafE family protein n=1 Tax=Faunimonas sp. B44 TaxID=3461493 RepID=UPI004044A254